MEHARYSLGLDVDKVSIKACLKVKKDSAKSLVKATKTFSNTILGFKELDQWIKKHKKLPNDQLKINMEATGVYHEHLAWHLHQLNYLVHIILPLRAKRYMQSLGIKSKNDKIDAQGLADMGMQQELDQWKPCSKNLLLLRSLTRQIEMLQESRTAFRNQLESATHLANCDKMVIRNLKSWIAKIEKDIKKLKERIAQFIIEDPALQNKYKLVEPIKGLGVLTFATIIAETGGFELFENQKQLISYAGYDVVEDQSGKRVGRTRISKKGNTHIRRIMHMASFNMVTYKVSPFHQLYSRVYDRTKIKMKGYVAIQRKLLCMIYALWKNNTVFDPGYLERTTSGNHDPKALFSVGPTGPEMKVATDIAMATLDELPCNQSPEALFSVSQI
jgi:transposase